MLNLFTNYDEIGVIDLGSTINNFLPLLALITSIVVIITFISSIFKKQWTDALLSIVLGAVAIYFIYNMNDLNSLGKTIFDSMVGIMKGLRNLSTNKANSQLFFTVRGLF
jgi:hypothetical protein